MAREVWLALREFRERSRGDVAAALTYYAVVAVFPALIVVGAMVGVAGHHPETTNELLDLVERIGPAAAADTLRGTIEGVVRNRGGATALVGLGLAGRPGR